MSKRIAVLVSGGGTNLQAHQRPGPGRAGQREIAAVISSNPGAYALGAGREGGDPRLCGGTEGVFLQPGHDRRPGGKSCGRWTLIWWSW